jgi:hypothetical protein
MVLIALDAATWIYVVIVTHRAFFGRPGSAPPLLGR